MRYPKSILAALAVAAAAGGCVAGCGTSGGTVGSTVGGSSGGSSAGQASYTGYLSAAGGQPGASGPGGTGPHGGYSPVKNGPAPGVTASGARSAAAKFDSMYFGGRLSQAWDMLTPAARREIPRGTWAAVHQACASARPTVKSVTVFGTAAIVSESTGAGSAGTGPAGARGATVEYVLSYSKGTWSFAPGNVSVYHHGSASADVAAAKKAGLCAARPNVFLSDHPWTGSP